MSFSRALGCAWMRMGSSPMKEDNQNHYGATNLTTAMESVDMEVDLINSPIPTKAYTSANARKVTVLSTNNSSTRGELNGLVLNPNTNAYQATGRTFQIQQLYHWKQAPHTTGGSTKSGGSYESGGICPKLNRRNSTGGR